MVSRSAPFEASKGISRARAMASLSAAEYNGDAVAGTPEEIERAAARTCSVVNLSPGISLSQIMRVFEKTGAIEICYRLGKRSAAVVFQSAESVSKALALSGTALKPTSSAKLPPCTIQVVEGVVKPAPSAKDNVPSADIDNNKH